jgi:small subunit ribosomal protein S17
MAEENEDVTDVTPGDDVPVDDVQDVPAAEVETAEVSSDAPAEEIVAESEAPEVEVAADASADESEADESATTTAAPAEAPASAPAPAQVSGPKPKKKRLPRPLRRARTKTARTKPAERKPIVRLEKPVHERGRSQERQGTVVSDAMDKTIVVKVDTIKAHRKYKKVVRRSTKFHAHDAENSAKVGDVVRIIETRPLSKTKRWRLAEIVEVAK